MALKNVLVTGAGSGVGRALTQSLADAGWRVFACVRSVDAQQGLATNPSVEVLTLDVTDRGSVAAAAGDVGAAVGDDGLHGLVNNAGVMVQGPLELVPIHALRRQFEVNVLGVMAVTQAFLPLLRRGRGTIVNVGAPSGRVTVPMAGPISASKTALESLTDALRMELKHQAVKVTIVAPGALQTPLWEKAAASAAADGYAGSGETQRMYAGAIEATAVAAARLKLAPVDRVVATMIKALESSRPDARYVVGRDAKQVVMLRHVPRGMRDRLLMGAMGLRRSAFRAGLASPGGERSSE